MTRAQRIALQVWRKRHTWRWQNAHGATGTYGATLEQFSIVPTRTTTVRGLLCS